MITDDDWRQRCEKRELMITRAAQALHRLGDVLVKTVADAQRLRGIEGVALRTVGDVMSQESEDELSETIRRVDALASKVAAAWEQRVAAMQTKAEGHRATSRGAIPGDR